ncbi:MULTISPECIES: (2Fe-2S)-binding protein [Bacillota]|jgi:aerobic carbon-monoxide dehydrogenase small subunit|uniref:2Fe-2S iron-sulfur cluster binding domain-containing protein n=2 Tax=Amedibacillus TaxID=2749846 RepID=A0A7G9GM15_9FIRM|nr:MULTISPECIES: 2Fe-2S iron-sulfur cluster-binding protein [Bacillota]QNM11847.1 2Fe-2S iron-sulfur cluster binding domain-containing protein [[Eubacterium] hominis]MCH4287230.1 2Fe-2S iron-sulfur cluster-binding protein [Amedibacillus hominis]RGB50643.1 (2Fe-2S)-binding protein [Absiella sp. AM22-9]RGB62920.1 (2Fe-2S)-binding protein [Absiella sp. AM10-20]RGB64845.1 (2Fe-2S)-binding protein [Absiella sp. AM09-45]
MQVMIKVNGTMIKEDIKDDMLLLDFLRDHGCYSVKRGCETSNCGLCTVWMDEKPILSCGMLVARANGHEITTLEGLEKEAHEFAVFMANEGAEQCGFCSPGLIMNVLAMDKELDHPNVDEINHYLAGNLCRCTGYMGQLRAVEKYLARDKEGKA